LAAALVGYFFVEIFAPMPLCEPPLQPLASASVDSEPVHGPDELALLPSRSSMP
jgi:hypothetical protein